MNPISHSPASKIKIFTDFDGTITNIDSLNMVLDEFAVSEWRPIEDRVTAHELTEKEALQAEFDLVNVSFETVINFLEKNATIDQTFKPFLDWCHSKNIELIVLSGGFKEFIYSIFKKFGINGLDIHSNSLNVKNNIWKVVQSDLPKIKKLCNHCKTNHLLEAKNLGFKTIYIGDGNTDRCPAENADVVFAKDSLADFLKNKKNKFYRYKNFSDIQNIITNDIIALSDSIDKMKIDLK
jgi:2-hydroxy-3-keto-5-methylthiopentenyl-1-phosphate phosphatase